MVNSVGSKLVFHCRICSTQVSKVSALGDAKPRVLRHLFCHHPEIDKSTYLDLAFAEALDRVRVDHSSATRKTLRCTHCDSALSGSRFAKFSLPELRRHQASSICASQTPGEGPRSSLANATRNDIDPSWVDGPDEAQWLVQVSFDTLYGKQISTKRMVAKTRTQTVTKLLMECVEAFVKADGERDQEQTVLAWKRFIMFPGWVLCMRDPVHPLLGRLSFQDRFPTVSDGGISHSS